jgi:hypothetical protein
MLCELYANKVVIQEEEHYRDEEGHLIMIKA